MPDDPSFPTLPPMSAATLLRALFKRRGRVLQAGAGALPAVLHITRHRLDHIDAGQLERYREALGFHGTHVPLTYYYLLAQRAHLATMLGASFPFRLAGAIHVDNALRAGIEPVPGRPLQLATEVRIAAPAANGAMHAALDTRATQDGALVFACRSTYLVVRGKRAKGSRTAATGTPVGAPLANWRLAPASGRAYAALSGDWNPIHLWGWSARLMGMKAPIIHGMHTLGKACAALEAATGRHVVSMSARFQAPVPLGSKATLAADPAAGSFVVTCNGGDAVRGTFSLA
jgi:acyl dehydratase